MDRKDDDEEEEEEGKTSLSFPTNAQGEKICIGRSRGKHQRRKKNNKPILGQLEGRDHGRMGHHLSRLRMAGPVEDEEAEPDAADASLAMVCERRVGGSGV